MAAEKINRSSSSRITSTGPLPATVQASYTQRQTPVPTPVNAGAGRGATLGAPVKAIVAANSRQTHVSS
jgi:hypothetical protein